jgi:glucose/arabinose dehydrogenase
MKSIAFSIVAAALAVCATGTLAVENEILPVQPGGKLPGNIAIQLVKVADGLVDPVDVTAPKDGSGRLFVCERPGVVRIIKDGKVLPKPFLDLRDKTLSSFVEEGLYCVEFHPKFKENGIVYVSYSDLWFSGSTLIMEYHVSKVNPDKADVDSARVIMQIDYPYCNHHGGKVKFGPDGYLYIGVGDGGWEGDVLDSGQDLSTWHGKMLRIDVNSGTADRAYNIPKDNPFITPLQQMTLFGVSELQFSKIHPRAKPEIWAYGIRNPWTFSFDRKTGDLYIADVGQNTWEEVDFQPASSKGGENYGWKLLHGSHPFPIELEKGAPRIGVLPIAEYSHVDQGTCVIGIGTYRGNAFPSMQGVYFVSDWGSGKIWGLKRDSAGKWQMQELLALATSVLPTSGGEDEEGNLYVTHAAASYGGPVDPYQNARGALWKIVPADKVPKGAATAPLHAK